MKYYTLAVVFLVSGIVYATPVQDLDNSISSLGLEIKQATMTETQATQIVGETNTTKSAVLVAGIVQATQGSNVDIPFTLIPGPAGIAAMQYNIVSPSGISISSVTVGPAALASSKTVTFSTGSQTALVFCAKQSRILMGVVAVAHLTVAASVVKGIYSLGLNSPVAEDINSIQIPLSLTSGTLQVK